MFGIFNKNKQKKVDPIFSVLNTDIHCHLIPCVDDGSKSFEETVECLNTMYEVGFRQLYITPHFQFPRFPNKEEDIKQRFETLKCELKQREVPIELLGIGGEYRVDDAFAARIKNPNFLTVDNKVLVELSLHQLRMGVEETLFDLGMGDHEVILAHPERYPYYSKHSQTLEALKEQGVYFQVNILSLSGFYGSDAQKNAFDYINNGWVDYLGTDMHNTVYAKATRDAAGNKKVRKVLEENQFLNSKIQK